MLHTTRISTGLAMTARAAAAGCRPWRMGRADYLAAVDAAARDGGTLHARVVAG